MYINIFQHISANIPAGAHTNTSYYEYLIVHDAEQAKEVLGFAFTIEPYLDNNVIPVDKYREDLEKRAPELGLKFRYISYFLWRKKLVIMDVSESKSPTANLPEPSEPPSYEDLSTNEADDSSPPPYDFDSKDSKTEVKKK